MSARATSCFPDNTGVRDAYDSVSHSGPDGRFFLEKSHRITRIELDGALPAIYQKVKKVDAALRAVFGQRVAANDERLKFAMINQHSGPHMNTVTSGVLQAGIAAAMPEDEVLAAALGTSEHDVGYFRHNPDDIYSTGPDASSRNKAAQNEHPIWGAEMVVDAIEELIKNNEDIRSEVSFWQSKHSNILFNTIRHHSNGSQYKSEEVSDVEKLARLFDKINNCNRVYPEHMAAYQALAHASPSDICEATRNRIQFLNSVRLLPAGNKKHSSFEQTKKALKQFDEQFMHRVVPYAITDEYAEHNKDNGRVTIHYSVDPDRISQTLGTTYTAELFSEHFQAAYDKSMLYAAEVVSSLAQRTLKILEPVKEILTVVMYFPDGSVEQIAYEAPKTSHSA